MAKFQTSARSIDMLGRQQIAGIPTAVSEIFKNAYDAYATSVRGDFFPDRRVLTVRDNGVGMTQTDFQTRWLTIGTDSKAEGTTLPPIGRPPGVRQRRQMGEKGIGRLAIATIAPQLTVVTRARSNIEGPDDHLTVALVQWSLFETPGLNLEDVAVPIRRVRSLDEVDVALIVSMRDEFLESLDALTGRISDAVISRIRSELDALETDVRPYLQLAGPRVDAGAGSAFILSGVYADLDTAMAVTDQRKSDYSISEFQRFLLGFTNTITPGDKIADFATKFMTHESTGPVDVIDPSSYFWEAADFDKTDHTIEGSFDDYGTFRGKIGIYGNEPIEIVQPWRTGGGNATACGSFTIKFGYVQGQASDSLLSPEEFTEMALRLEKIGGLYVYRDGIRVLPYGNSDYDYLGIEKRRSLNAATYFFSYRRMFGAIDLDSKKNSQLQEKAGREGFRENRAYRDFKDILTNFLISLASEYFSSRSGTSDEWKSERERIKKRKEIARERTRAEKQDRERFDRELFEAINYVEAGGLAADILRVRSGLEKDLERARLDGATPDTDVLEARSVTELLDLSMKLRVERPAGLPLSKEQERELSSFERLEDFAQRQLADATIEVHNMLDVVGRSSSEGTREDIRRRRLRLLASREAERLKSLRDEAKTATSRMRTELDEIADRRWTEFEAEVSSILASGRQLEAGDEFELTQTLRTAVAAHASVYLEISQFAQSLNYGQGILRENTSLKEEVLDLQAQLDENMELLQLGQAVQIVSHEFEASISTVRNGLKALGPWAKSTPRLLPIVRDLRASFSHLDGYLRLFTPLQRRLYREAVIIRGFEIESFVRGVFNERLLRHEVTLEVTSMFEKWSFEGYPSTLYPSFINLVDNALHWVADGAQVGKRKIILDWNGKHAIIRDSGPGIKERDREAIFERGFSRRRGGRGLGLSLAREILSRDGWKLEVGEVGPGAVFHLSPPVESSENDD